MYTYVYIYICIQIDYLIYIYIYHIFPPTSIHLINAKNTPRLTAGGVLEQQAPGPFRRQELMAGLGPRGVSSSSWGYPNSWLVYFTENPVKINDVRVPLFLGGYGLDMNCLNYM